MVQAGPTMLGERNARCPNCGGPIAFGIGASAALVCPHCRYAVVRSDRELSALGRVADLVPTAPPIAVGDSGMVAGRPFRVAGRVQLDHGRGPWDEWYLGFDDGSWGWLARAQGRWYVTTPTGPGSFPPWEAMRPGVQRPLSPTGPAPWTVSEQGTSTVISGEGELPFPIASGQQGWYVDLVGPAGAFATLDYGDGRETPRLFAGRELAPSELTLAQGGGPRPEERVALGKVGCPSCGAPVELHSASSERAACAYCYTLLDVTQGNLQVVEKLRQSRLVPQIPLGTRGTLGGEALTVVGFMERFTVVGGMTFAWREYLLYGDQGYRWLLEDGNHWTFLTPISAGDVRVHGRNVVYSGKSHRRFSSNSARVRFVIGEFYWKVQVDEEALATDFVAPPSLLSEERSHGEVVWSSGRYVDAKELWAAFRLPGSPPRASGVAPSQPNPHRVLPTLVSFAALFVALLLVAGAFIVGKPRQVLVEGPLALPDTPAVAGSARAEGAEDRASYTPTFQVTGGPTTLAVELRTNAQQAWVGVACALIDEVGGEVREFPIEASYYSGVEGGESWSEGSPTMTTYLAQVPSGTYSLRLDPQWTGAAFASPPEASIRVEQGSSSGACCCGAFFLLLLPVPFALYRRFAFEKKRWENAS